MVKIVYRISNASVVFRTYRVGCYSAALDTEFWTAGERGSDIGKRHLPAAQYYYIDLYSQPEKLQVARRV